MGVPRIKIHQLPQNFTPDIPDVKVASSDELLPVIDKDPLLRVNITTLTGVVKVPVTACQPIDLNAGRQTFNLLSDGTLSGVSYTDLVTGVVGNYELRVLDANNALIDPSQYVVVGGVFTFLGTSVGTKVSAYARSNTPATNWALPYDNPYQGGNEHFNKLIVVANGGQAVLATASGTNSGIITLTSPASTLTATYYHISTKTKTFIGEQTNWVQGHMNMEPDVFVGMQDYPGNDYTTAGNGTTSDTTPQFLPSYIDRSKLQIDYRNGAVIFLHDDVDTTALGYGYFPFTSYTTVPSECPDGTAKVRCNYAYLDGIKNVDQQVLDVVSGSSGKSFRASSEQIWTQSHGKRMVGKVTNFLPRNIYVNGVKTPNVVTVTNEVMTIKTA